MDSSFFTACSIFPTRPCLSFNLGAWIRSPRCIRNRRVRMGSTHENYFGSDNNNNNVPSHFVETNQNLPDTSRPTVQAVTCLERWKKKVSNNNYRDQHPPCTRSVSQRSLRYLNCLPLTITGYLRNQAQKYKKNCNLRTLDLIVMYSIC